MPHSVLYTDAAFKEHGDASKYLLSQVPYHPAKRYFLPFMMGAIPEWRGKFSNKWLNKNLRKEYGKLYAFVYSVNCLNYADWIARQINVPLIVHVADHSELFEKANITKVLKRCAKLICITEEMKSKYEVMLGRKDIEVLHNGAEECCFTLAYPNPVTFNEKNPLRLCFLGGLFSHLHGDCIEDVANAVSISRCNKKSIEFHLYGQINPSSFGKDMFREPGVTHHGIIMPLAKKFEIMEKAHCFVIPSSFDPKNHRHYRYSFPTKLPELIASGRPIISYGPRNTASNRLLEDHSIGIRIHERSVQKLTSAFSFVADRYSDLLKANISKRLTYNNIFSAEKVQRKLSEILNF